MRPGGRATEDTTTVPRRWSTPRAAERARVRCVLPPEPPAPSEGAGANVLPAGAARRDPDSRPSTSTSSGPLPFALPEPDEEPQSRAPSLLSRPAVVRARHRPHHPHDVRPGHVARADDHPRGLDGLRQRARASCWSSTRSTAPTPPTGASTDNGQRWMNPTGRNGFALVSRQGRDGRLRPRHGRMRPPSTPTSRHVTMQFDFSLDKLTGGSGVKVMAVLRKSKAGSYESRVRDRPRRPRVAVRGQDARQEQRDHPRAAASSSRAGATRPASRSPSAPRPSSRTPPSCASRSGQPAARSPRHGSSSATTSLPTSVGPDASDSAP